MRILDFHFYLFLFVAIVSCTNIAKRALPTVSADTTPIPSPTVDVWANVAKASHLTQYGITWTFSAPVPYGKFVNGDYWVGGPVTVTSVSPGWDGHGNGSMIDPVPFNITGGYQGFDSRINAYYAYSDTARVQFPVTINADGTHSLLSAISLANPTNYYPLTDMAVLTVVSAEPAAGSFRPAFVSGTKKIWTTAQVNYGLVPTFPVPSTPFQCPIHGDGDSTLPDMSQTMVKMNPYFGQTAWATTIIPSNNVSSQYPAYENWVSSVIALEAMLNIPQREEYINRIIQRGIDHYSIALQNYRGYEANGGYGTGIKWPILFAGILLNDSSMKAPPSLIADFGNGTLGKFSEDSYTYIGQPTAAFPLGKPLMGVDLASEGYPMSGCLSNCMARDPAGVWEPEDNPNGQGGSYRQLVSNPWVGQALAARLMGAMATWNHDAYFSYVDAWVKDPASWTAYDRAFTEGAYGYSDSSCFVANMWTLYR